MCVPSQYYLGSALVDQKTNEIPVAQQLFGDLDLAGRNVSLDALHTQTETARQLVMDHGANYLLTYMFLGNMALADAMRSLKLFKAEVMPAVERL